MHHAAGSGDDELGLPGAGDYPVVALDSTASPSAGRCPTPTRRPAPGASRRSLVAISLATNRSGDRSQHRRTGRSSADGAGTGPHHAPSDAHPRRRAQSCGACSMDPVHPLRHRRSPRRGTDRPLVTVRPCPERSRTMKPFPGAQLRRRPADAPDADAPEPDHPARAHEQQQTDGAQGARWLSCGGRVPAGRACKALATFLASPCGHRFSGDPVGRPILGVVRAARFGTSHLGRPNGDGEEPALLGARLGVTFSVTMATFRDIRLWLRGSRRSSRRPLLCA